MLRHSVLLLVAFFTACTSEIPIQNQTEKYVEHDSIDSTYNKPVHPKLATLPSSKTGDSAALLGTLEIKDGCIYAKAVTNELFLIASMNPDIYWDDHQQALILSSGKAIKPGQPVMLGGSSYIGPQERLKWTLAPNEGCHVTQIWITNSVS
jgi:hypothetical protein